MTSVSEQTGRVAGAFQQSTACARVAAALKNAAFARFSELGFPTTKNEEWRFTNVAPIARTKFVGR